MGVVLLILLFYLGLGLLEWKRYGHTATYHPLEGAGRPWGRFMSVLLVAIVTLPWLYVVYYLLTQPW